MAMTLEERVSVLETLAKEHGRMAVQHRDEMGGLEQRMDRRFELLDAKLSRHFMWLAGMHLTTMAAVVAALVAR